MNESPTANEAAEQRPSRRNRSRQVLLWCGFLVLMFMFFLAGYYLTGAYRSAASPTTPARVDISDDNVWEQLPPPPPPPGKVTPAVEVIEISPAPKPSDETPKAPVPSEQTGSDSPSADSDPPAPAPSIAPPTHPPAPKPAPAPPPDTKRYIVQMGVYADRANAEIVSANLADHGYASSIRQISRNGSAQYQVAVGNPKDKAGADALAAELRKAGREVVITPVE